jgi:hypothetical protein
LAILILEILLKKDDFAAYGYKKKIATCTKIVISIKDQQEIC